MEQARGDLNHARKSIPLTDFDWACFAAQQSAEKAVKAVHLSHGAIVWGHSVFDALDAFPPDAGVTGELREAALRLDKFYIPTRYPDAYPSGPSRRYYTEADAQQAVADAEKVVNWCDQSLPSPAQPGH